MANLEGMPIGSLPEATDIQDEDEIVVYRPSTGKAYQANTDLIDSLSGWSGTNSSRTVAFKTSMQIQFLLIGGYDWLYLVYFNLNSLAIVPMEIYSTDSAKPPVTVENDTVSYQVKVTRNSGYAGWFIASPSCQIEVS